MTTDAHTDASPGARDEDAARTDENFVPAWLAILVLVLLLAVMGVGGYVIRGMVTGDQRVTSVAEADVARWRGEVKRSPGDMEARLQLGYAYQQAKRYDEALNSYETVLKKDPSNTAAQYNRGECLVALGLDDKAEEAFWAVLNQTRDHPLAAKALGEIYAERGQYKSLLSAVRPVVEIHPEMADLQYLTGLAYENLNHRDWAIARYRLALEYSPDYVKARDALKRLGVKP